jgi:hypothetical protein
MILTLWQTLTRIDYKYLVEVFSALLTPAIAIIATYVAVQQWRIQKNRLALELYERRLTLYKAVDSFYGEVSTAGSVKYPPVFKLRVDTAEAPFLFGNDIEKHLNEVFQTGIRAAALYEQMYPSSRDPGLPVGPERTKVAEEHSQLVLWLSQNAKAESRKLFGKYLKLA